MGIDVVVLRPEGIRRVHLLEVGHQVRAVEDAIAQVAFQRGQPGAAEDAAQVAQRRASPYAGPVRQRRSGQHQRPRQFGMQRAGHHDLPAGLAVANQRRLAIGLRMQFGHAGNETRFGAAYIFDGLLRFRQRQEANEIARVAGFQHHANLAVLLHAADAGTMAGARIEHNEGPLARFRLDAVGRLDAQQDVIDGARHFAAVHHHLEIEVQHMRRDLRGARIALVAALAQHIEEQHRALAGVNPIVSGLLGQVEGEVIEGRCWAAIIHDESSMSAPSKLAQIR